mmetsp:Transcript_12468/g.30114  ORF Transcript_12468/g.30114 Transcript_12468/m.30114 type:complete len:331 (+) Transcript_12468:43-1035(+)|eukprot:CAMPEP_0169447976 /NCGR_PEP_ID=MMETSP1042-20121227/11796_1 /TAXON_ID=464988 /ORGANISM="Hemiselmis andersenii, Strain CCMP1180" /LENGTH=330 /DNA_ID=CAMNT_0009559547 /DNA_START=37 /DNA_END=1029 /DNA_ORIENTATION=+
MPKLLSSALLAGACLVGNADAFSLSPSLPSPSLRQASSSSRLSSLSMQLQEGTSPISRRQALSLAALASLSLSPIQKADAAGVALGYGANEKDINAELAAFGLQKFDKVPGGFKPLIQAVGGNLGANIDGSKVVDSLGSLVTANGGLKEGERLLVLFAYPSAWLVNLPIVTPNGESGTVSANNYVKGDSAVVNAKGIKADDDIAALPNTFFEALLTQFLTVNQFQGFKVMKKTKGTPIDGQAVMDIEFRYDLLTQGGLSVGRHGFCKAIQCGTNVVSLGATTTDLRFKGQKDALKQTAESFRAHVVKAEFASARSQGLNINTPQKEQDDE